MQPARTHTPTVFVEQGLEGLRGKLSEARLEEVRQHVRAFTEWVAKPALNKNDPRAAVEHVLRSAGTAAQFKGAFVQALAEVPGGLETFLEYSTEHLGQMPSLEDRPALAEAVDYLQRAQRTWLRFLVFHPDAQTVLSEAAQVEGFKVLDLGFHADNLLTVALIGATEEEIEVEPVALEGLVQAAREWTAAYYQAMRELVEQAGAGVDEDDPFEPRTVSDLLSLPPYDGPAVTVEEMDEAIAAHFGAE